MVVDDLRSYVAGSWSAPPYDRGIRHYEDKVVGAEATFAIA
jgi:hypothetical protein